MTNNIPAISFRLTPEEYSLWQALAHESGLTEGTYAKQLAILHIRDKQKEFGLVPARKFPKKTEELLANAFISDEIRIEKEEEEADKNDILSGDDELVFIEEPYIGELDSEDFKDLKRETDNGGW